MCAESTRPSSHSFFGLLGRHLFINLLYAAFFLGVYFKVWYKGEPSFLEGQIHWTRVFMSVSLFHMLLAVGLHWQRIKAGWNKWMQSPTSPWDLAIFRILFLSAVVWDMQGWAFKYGLKWTSFPRSQMVPLPYLGWLQDILPISPKLYTAAAIAATVLLLLAILGMFTRAALLLYLPLGFYIWAVPCFYGKLNHNQIMLWFPLLLALGRSSDVLSIDSLWRRWRRPEWRPPTRAVEYGTPIRFVLLLLAVIYFWAGVYKFWDSGFDWALSNSMISQFQLEWAEHYDRMPWIRIDHWPWLCKLGGVAVIYFEMLFIFLLFHPWTRAMAFAIGLSFHHGTSMFLYIDFMMIRRTYLAFVPWFAWRQWIAVRLGLASLEEEEPEHERTLRELRQSWWNKALWWTGWTLLIVNFVCGMFKIHSFPFSAYPNYSSLVKNRYKTLEIVAWDKKGDIMFARLLGKMMHFRQENILPLQRSVMEALEEGKKDLAKKRARHYFNIWRSHVGPLELAVKVRIYYRETYLVPEQRNTILKQFVVTEFTLPGFVKKVRTSAVRKPKKPSKRRVVVQKTRRRKNSRPTQRRQSHRSTTPTTRPVAQPTTRPTTQPAHRPTSRPVFKPGKRPTTKPVDTATSQPVSKPATRPATSSPASSRPTSVPSR